MYFYVVLAFQIYCIYHMYKNGKSYYWAILIFLVPLLGCIIYLITQIYNKQDAEKLTSEITHVINPTKKLNDFEARLKFSDSYQNRLNLADAFFEAKDYSSAITHYLIILEDTSQNNFYATTQLIEAYFNIENFEKVITYTNKIKERTQFKKSRTQFLYGLALDQTGATEAAEANLRQIDVPYSFYEERLGLAKFLLANKKSEDASIILKDVKMESSRMTKMNQRIYRATIIEVEQLLKTINN